MKPYLDMLSRILDEGIRKENRTGIDTIAVFGHQLRFDLREGFPLVTTKKIHLKSVLYELLWMLNGDTNVRYLQERGVRIWNEWADEDGELGPVYGRQWRAWWGPGGTHDQIAEIVEKLEKKPDDRRLLLSAWNVAEVPDMRLPPCHLLAQLWVAEGRLSCHMYIRSWDTFLGGPFNIAQYALLTHILAHTTRLSVGDLVISSGDTHLYENHIEQAREQISREPRPRPTLEIKDRGQDIRSRRHGMPPLDHQRYEPYQFDDFVIEGYDPHPHIKAKVAV